MRTPCEWTVSDFVPSIRFSLVQELNKKGKTQLEIASLLSISQPRVSQYINERRNPQSNKSDSENNKIINQMSAIVNQTVKNILPLLMQKKSPAEAIPIICAGCRELRVGNAICSLHKLNYNALNLHLGLKSCDLCLKWKDSPLDSKYSIEKLESRIELLKTLEGLCNNLITKLNFLEFIPQIGAQLCLMHIESNEELPKNIAGYPGRIIKYQSQAKIVSSPKYNASKTTGNFLLEMRKLNPDLTAILCLKNHQTQLLKLENFKTINTVEGDKRGFIEQIRPKMKSENIAPTRIAILDSGSIGFEPIAYFLVVHPYDLLNIFD